MACTPLLVMVPPEMASTYSAPLRGFCPFFSTDTAAVLRAAEIGADVILLAKNIDGVYDCDPKKNPDAKLIRRITYTDAIAKQLQFMDTAALAICMENKLPIQVFNLHQKGNIQKALCGEEIGTTIY